MQCFADLHAHILYGVDDGAKTPADMCAMLDAAYQSGTRVLCATPHYHPGLFENTTERANKAFQVLSAHAAQYADLKLVLANELRYDPGCIPWLQSGDCRTLGETRCVLVDFDRAATCLQIKRGVRSLLNAGYRPVLAHAELYSALPLKEVHSLVEDGAIVQVDANSLLGDFGFCVKRRCHYLLKHRLAAVVASDMHDIRHRPPCLQAAYNDTVKRYGKQYADAVFYQNVLRILQIGRNMNHE